MPRYLRLALIAFVGFYLFHSPRGAAHPSSTGDCPASATPATP